MSATISATKAIEGDLWKITLVVTSGDIPADIFMYENTGHGLGDYVGVCSINDYRRMQTHVPNVDVALFGNKFLKYSQGVKLIPLSLDPQATIDKMVVDIKTFRTAFLAAPGSTQIVVIS